MNLFSLDRRVLLLTCLFCVTVSAVNGQTTVFAEEPDHAVVPGYERFARGANAAIPDNSHWVTEHVLLQELNCVACHITSAANQSLAEHSKRAPNLEHVGQRVHVEYLRTFIANPQHVKPGTTMPQLFHGAAVDEAVTRQSIESIVHFLASTGQLDQRPPKRQAVGRGKELFHSVGCVACHGPQTDDSVVARDTSVGEATGVWVPLGKLSEKYSIPSLTGFLKNPHDARPAGRMPTLGLNDQESSSIAAYLLRDLDFPANISYRTYRGSWDRLPDFSQLTPDDEGTTTEFDVTDGSEKNQFGMQFETQIQLASDGDYEFFLASDDGSRLTIDGKVIVDNDGVHPTREVTQQVRLVQGRHDVVVEYFEQGGEEILRVEIAGPNLNRTSLDSLVISDSGQHDAAPERFVVDPERASVGRELFVRVGCDACHQMPGLPQAKTARTPLKKLRSDQGCLASTVPENAPRFALDNPQRAALARAMARAASADEARSEDFLQTQMIAANCYACHQRGDVGGIPHAINNYVTSTQPEMGEEGRLPPPLNAIGDKLRADWMRQLIERGGHDRPNLRIRMPGFGSLIAKEVSREFASLDAVQGDDGDELPSEFTRGRQKAAGRQMAGESGYSCVKCHVFGDTQASGIQAISLTTMHERLRPSWFRRYMLDPQEYRPGTRMPSSWPRGQVMLPKILDGQASSQIQAIWLYLTDGPRAQMPQGLGKNVIELVATDEAIIYRNFIEGGGPRAIGVGYPERVNQAFDANDVRVALLWHGAFMDASRHWTGRGQGYSPPLGDNVLRLPNGPSLAVLESPDSPWPTGVRQDDYFQFLGYRLNEKRQPTFRYRIGDAVVEDFCEPIGDKPYGPLKRTIGVTAPDSSQMYWWRLAADKTIDKTGNAKYVTSSGCTLQLETGGDVQPVIRKQGDQQELLLPMAVDAKGLRASVQYHW
ncbi:MAG: c-type cytochrome [Planctomycetales bacterium]|nr:c-type cytochrome [Planctomycetales bacterium]